MDCACVPSSPQCFWGRVRRNRQRELEGFLARRDLHHRSSTVAQAYKLLFWSKKNNNNIKTLLYTFVLWLRFSDWHCNPSYFVWRFVFVIHDVMNERDTYKYEKHVMIVPHVPLGFKPHNRSSNLAILNAWIQFYSYLYVPQWYIAVSFNTYTLCKSLWIKSSNALSVNVQ